MRRVFAAILLAVFILFTGTIHAEKQPTIQRLGDGDLIPVKTMLRFTTLIALPEGEEILEVACGDKEFWVIEGKDSNVHVKPAKEGARTNLNIVSKSRVVYSFLLEEVSSPRGRPAKEKPDLIVRVNPEEVSQLRKDKDNLGEALSRAERELKAEKERALEAERKHLQTKEEVKPAPKKEQQPRTAAPATPAMPPAVTQPKAAASTQALVPVPAQSHLFSVYAIENDGVLQKTGRAVGNALRRVGRFIRLF